MLEQLKKCQNKFHQFNLVDQKSLRKIIAKIESVDNISIENIAVTVSELKFLESSTSQNEKLTTEKTNNYNEKILKLGCEIFNEKPQILKIKDVEELWKQLNLNGVGIRKGISSLDWPLFGIGVQSPPEKKVIKPDLINLCLDDYLKIFHSPQKKEKFNLIQVCLLLHHYFELIHPFKDGNGRLGRTLISLFLIKNKIWVHNLFFPISYSIKKNKRDYLNKIAFFHENNTNKNVIKFENANSWGKKISYLDFLKTEKINYQNYLQTMETFFNKTIETTEKLFTIYSKFKSAIKKQLQAMNDGKKFKVFKKRENLINEITMFLTSDVVIMLHDFKKVININDKTIDKIMGVLCYKKLFFKTKKTFPNKNSKEKTIWKTFVFYTNQKIQQHFKETAFT